MGAAFSSYGDETVKAILFFAGWFFAGVSIQVATMLNQLH
jgi:hypothetical protein